MSGGERVTVFAPAKVNLTLEVLGNGRTDTKNCVGDAAITSLTH